ncbi:MAG TPA: helix-turn-helix domain-containing protein [Chthoniobacterales bacterium]|nr:helix-turn-helix domain-containing protein [Chthoniobacterales bacterium]
MEGLGKKLQEARLARGLTLDEAGRMTKIRPAQLQEIENEDFSQFASLAYAKGFLLIYGKFLDVDVSPYLEAFETSETLTTDGYSYLQDAPEPEPIRPAKVRRRSAPVSSGGGRSSFMPLIIGILVLVIGFTVMRWLLQMQRLKPRPTPPPGSTPVATATVSDKIIAPHAQPVESTTPPTTATTPEAAATATATAAPTNTPAAIPAPSSAEPEVRRAEPVHPEDAASIPSPTPTVKRTPRPPRSPTPARPTPTITARPR